MSFWFLHGLRKGVQSTRYPARVEKTPGVSPGRPVNTDFSTAEEAQRAAEICPTEAIVAHGKSTYVNPGKCVHCQLCLHCLPSPMNWESGYEWTRLPANQAEAVPLPSPFAKSMHIMVVDAGDCGACLHEVKQLNNPLYNMHRLGFFMTATPRTADLLLVVGPVSENMRGPLLKTWEAMPTSRKLMAVGSCAISGGVFGKSFMSACGVGSVLPVDFEVPGDPPPPLAILHGLLVVAGRKSLKSLNPLSEGRP